MCYCYFIRIGGNVSVSLLQVYIWLYITYTAWYICYSSLTQAKHLQFVSGVHTTSYWLGNFVWDLLNAAVPIIITLILFAAFQVEAYSGEGLGAVFLLFVSTHGAGEHNTQDLNCTRVH